MLQRIPGSNPTYVLRPKLHSLLGKVSPTSSTTSSTITRVRTKRCFGFNEVILIHLVLGTTHGFAIRPNLGIPAIKEGFEKGFDQTVDWFKKTLCK